MIAKLGKLARQNYWIILAILALALRFLLKNQAAIVESYYSRGLFVLIRKIFDAVSFLSPIPLMYLFIGLVLFYLVKKIILLFKGEQKWTTKILSFALNITNLIAALVFLFLLLWGYNYLRIPIEKQMGFVPKPLPIDELWEELQLMTPILIEARNKVDSVNELAFDKHYIPSDFEKNINQEVQSFLKKNDYPIPSSPNARFLKPKGVLLLNSTAGIYFPFVGESNIDAGLHPLTQPYILAHELAHAYGFGDEGTCNFIAYLACRQAKNAFVSYSGILGYWRTLASNFLAYQPKKYRTFRKTLPKGIIADLDAINKEHAQYPDIFPRFRNATYDAFLKAQGIAEGMKNYDRVVMLGKAWRLAQEKKLPDSE